VLQLLVTANVLSSSPIRVTLMMGAIRSPGTLVLTRGTRLDIREDGILHSDRREKLNSNIKENLLLSGGKCSSMPKENNRTKIIGRYIRRTVEHASGLQSPRSMDHLQPNDSPSTPSCVPSVQNKRLLICKI
jgi:hypothetical protein